AVDVGERRSGATGERRVDPTVALDFAHDPVVGRPHAQHPAADAVAETVGGEFVGGEHDGGDLFGGEPGADGAFLPYHPDVAQGLGVREQQGVGAAVDVGKRRVAGGRHLVERASTRADAVLVAVPEERV